MHAPVFGNLQVVIAPVVLVALGADRREQVPRELAVNLKRAHLDPDLRAGAAAPDDGARALALDSGEQIRAYPRDEARIVVESDVVDPASVVPASVVAPEGVRLASARLSVRHDPDVVSIPCRSQGGLAYRRVNLLLSLVELPRVIEGEVLGVPRPRVAARHPVAPRDVEAPPRSQVALDARHRAHAHGYAGVADHLPITSGERHDDSASPDAPLLVRSTPRMGKFSNAGRNARGSRHDAGIRLGSVYRFLLCYWLFSSKGGLRPGFSSLLPPHSLSECPTSLASISPGSKAYP